MIDRIISRTLTTIIVTMISGLAAGALLCGYYGFLEMLTGQFARGSAVAAISPLLAWASYLLVQHRDDLTDRGPDAKRLLRKS